MKQGWKIMDFESCIDKIKTTTKLQSSLYGEQGAFPIVSQEKELISGYWNKEENVFKHKTPIVVFGDHTKVVKYIDFDFVIGADGVKILSPKPFLNPKYFYYWVCSVQIPSRGYARHYRYLKEHQVPVPSLSEQQRIVALLDAEFAKIDALKANAEKNLQNTKDLFQAALKKELEPKEGWKVQPLKDVSEEMFAGGDAPKDSMSKDITPKYQIPIYANAVEKDGLYGFTDTARVRKPSITIAGRGSGTGYVIERNEAYFPIVRLIVILPNEQIIGNRYLYYAICSLNIKPNGSAIPQLTIPMIANYSIPYPNIEKQSQIVSRLDTLNEKCKALQANYEKTLSLCDDLKQALLRKAFNGEI